MEKAKGRVWEEPIPKHPGLYYRCWRVGKQINRRIWMRYTDANHRPIRESTGSDSIADAVAILEKRKTDAREGKFPILNKGKKIKFEIFKDQYLAWKKIDKPRSYTFYSSIVDQLNRHFARFHLDQITSPIVREYMMQQRDSAAKYRGKTVSAPTVNRKLAVLRNLLNHAVKEKYLTKNPVEDWREFFGEERERQRIFSSQEIDALLAAASYPMRDFILLAINTGCRLQEIKGLPWHEVDLGRRVINLTAARTKGKKDRTIPMNDVVHDLLSQRQLQRDAVKQQNEKKKWPIDQGTEWVFPNPETGMPYTTISHMWKQLLKKAGIKPLPGQDRPRFHDFRHTLGTNLAMGGVPQKVIQELYGHKHSRMTDRYTRATDEMKKKALAVAQHGVPAGEMVKLPDIKSS